MTRNLGGREWQKRVNGGAPLQSAAIKTRPLIMT